MLLEISVMRSSYNRISVDELADFEAMFNALNENSTRKDYHILMPSFI
jgi:hypothetical protein